MVYQFALIAILSRR